MRHGDPKQLEYWHTCPTCKQAYTKTTLLGLARAHWELERGSLHLGRVISAASMFGIALQSSGDLTGALPMLEHVAVASRRFYGDGHYQTLHAVGHLAMHIMNMNGNHLTLARAVTLQEEVFLAYRTLGPEREDTLRAMSTLGTMIMGSTGDYARARPMLEAAVEGLRALQTNAATITEILHLGICVESVGDASRGRKLMEEALHQCRRVMGDGHPKTHHCVQTLAQTRNNQRSSAHPGGTRAFATLVGLVGRPELNGSPPTVNAAVLGFDARRGRYLVHHQDRREHHKPLGIKSSNLVFLPGTAVVVDGLKGCDEELNGQRGIVQSYTAGKGYELKGIRAGIVLCTLHVQQDNCRLESAVDQERTQQPEPQ